MEANLIVSNNLENIYLDGFMQKMPLNRSRFAAYTVPIDTAAGSAGGTAIVIMSNARLVTSPGETCLLYHKI